MNDERLLAWVNRGLLASVICYVIIFIAAAYLAS
jgi:hypothetical protein